MSSLHLSFLNHHIVVMVLNPSLVGGVNSRFECLINVILSKLLLHIADYVHNSLDVLIKEITLFKAIHAD